MKCGMKLLLMSNEIDILLDDMYSYLSLCDELLPSKNKTKQNKKKYPNQKRVLSFIYRARSQHVHMYVVWQHEAFNDRSFITIAVVDTLILT